MVKAMLSKVSVEGGTAGSAIETLLKGCVEPARLPTALGMVKSCVVGRCMVKSCTPK